MKHRLQIPLRHFFATPPTPCPYLPGLMERKVVTLLAGDDPDGLHNALSQAGFRRSQDLAYRPACENCNACIPVRVPVADFQPSDSQKRLWRRRGDIVTRQLPAYATREHYMVFRRYVTARHEGGGMADMEFADYRAMVEDSPVRTGLTEFRFADGRLLGVCLTDEMSDGISLVYSFFDPDFERSSPGSLIILWHIEQARETGRAYLYLGYWIANSGKMAYKAKFRPLEMLTPSGWFLAPPHGQSENSPKYEQSLGLSPQFTLP
ncbi:arginyltransferase [Ferrovibrio sp.]|uniref:arginyltransferase n=1 Tax=Ferrovibrio sp. TaxID=1917215 RepID=UPI0025C6025F|nr:arginyltransferase [Ferrovibrio sp.]MBX3454049.1 arginyltransferase [Ferrovibrio sp.]